MATLRTVREDQHGTRTGYIYGCREECCRAAAREYAHKHRDRPRIARDPRPELTAAWRLAVAKGVAGRMCDRIVAQRDPPERLLRALGL